MKLTTKMTDKAIEQTVELFREHLIQLSDAGSLSTDKPVPLPDLWLHKDDLIEIPVYEVGDLVKSLAGTILEVISVTGSQVTATNLNLDQTVVTDSCMLSPTGRKIMPKDSVQFKDGDAVWFKDSVRFFQESELFAALYPSLSAYSATVIGPVKTTGLSANLVTVSVRLNMCGVIRPWIRIITTTVHSSDLVLA